MSSTHRLSRLKLAATYEDGGAAAVSVLTDAPFFGGSLADLRDVAGRVSIPVLRKDFILGEEQLLEARAAGASAALLIVRALDQDRLRRLIAFAQDIGLVTLVETHTAVEILRALDAGADVIGVNSRDLDTFEVDVPRALELISSLPSDCVAVAESGMAERLDVVKAAAAGADAALVGGALAGASSVADRLQDLTGVPRHGR